MVMAGCSCRWCAVIAVGECLPTVHMLANIKFGVRRRKPQRMAVDSILYEDLVGFLATRYTTLHFVRVGGHNDAYSMFGCELLFNLSCAQIDHVFGSIFPKQAIHSIKSFNPSAQILSRSCGSSAVLNPADDCVCSNKSLATPI